ncbi:transposase family protein, partial [Sphingobium sp. AS12]|uniref:integrase catalytic domain-containing protein n=1 Tax=Sphingobium sp. AS12 TaxID=2849495 RepID=UPI001C31C99F
SFGKLQFVHVSVDTFSHLIFTSAHSGEKVKNGKSHSLQAFAYMGVPKQIKTDNGPAYVSRGFNHFCQDFEITLKTGIPYNPQGQAIVEHAHHTLKAYLVKVKKGDLDGDIGSLTLSLIFYLKLLTVDDSGNSVVDCHWWSTAQKRHLVNWRDLPLGFWKGPDPVWCGPRVLFVFSHRMARPQFGFLSVVCSWFLLICFNHLMTHWVLGTSPHRVSKSCFPA